MNKTVKKVVMYLNLFFAVLNSMLFVSRMLNGNYFAIINLVGAVFGFSAFYIFWKNAKQQ